MQEVYSAFSNHFYFSGWDSSLNLNKYIELTLTPDLGNSLNLGDLTYSVESTTSDNVDYFFRSSLDGFSTNLDTFTTIGEDVQNQEIDLSILGEITSPVTFRWYAVTSNTSIQAGLANHEVGGAGGGLPDVGRDIVFSSSQATAAVPFEFSPTLGILAVGGILGISQLRKKLAVNTTIEHLD